MSKFKVVGAALTLALAVPAAVIAQSGGGVAAAAASNSWGSVFFSPTNRAYGYSYRQASSAAAEAAALASCAKNAANCQRGHTFQNTCGAVIFGGARGGFYAGQGATQNLAVAQGVQSCVQAMDGGCTPIRAQCSDSATGASFGSSAVAPNNAKWGAIYYSFVNRQSGASWKSASQASAEAVAQKQCLTKSNNCVKGVSFSNACGAVAVALSGGWASGTGATQGAADTAAVAGCRVVAKAPDCLVVRRVCSNG